MAKALIACFRENTKVDFTRFFSVVSQRIKPDNADVNEPYLYNYNGVVSYIYNPTTTVKRDKNGLCLGVAQDSLVNLFEPRAPRPDGTFALFRANSRYVEVLSDYTASRTIWYCETESLFVASTSQRMIIMLLGGFQPNREAFSWMLSTGTLGPGFSWDGRIRQLSPNSTILFDRNKWEMSINNFSDLSFQSGLYSKIQLKNSFKKAIKDVISALNIEPLKWSLALSGGMDSRSILYYLRNSSGINGVTWGLKQALKQPDSDAAIGKRLAESCGLPHRYAETDFASLELSVILARFLTAGEGRIDHLSGYMDGLKLWSDLSVSRRGIIRGYDALGGTRPVVNEFQVRRTSRLLVTSDYTNNVIPKEFSLSKDDIPKSFSKRKAESLAQWRDRLWLEFRTPAMTAALDDIKVAYVEIVNPLLCRRVVKVIQTLPDNLRTNKTLFREIVKEMFPGVPFATRDSIQYIDDIVKTEQLKIFLKDSLLYARKLNILPEDFLLFLVDNIDKDGRQFSQIRYTRRTPLSRRILEFVPDFVQNIIWWVAVRRQPLNINRLALRALIIIRMNELLLEDAKVVRKTITGRFRTRASEIK